MVGRRVIGFNITRSDVGSSPTPGTFLWDILVVRNLTVNQRIVGSSPTPTAVNLFVGVNKLVLVQDRKASWLDGGYLSSKTST